MAELQHIRRVDLENGATTTERFELTITPERVAAFCAAIGDENVLHTEAHNILVPGQLILGLVTGRMEKLMRKITPLPGMIKWDNNKFHSAVTAPARLTVESKITGAGRFRLMVEATAAAGECRVFSCVSEIHVIHPRVAAFL